MRSLALLAVLLSLGLGAYAQEISVSGSVSVVHPKKGEHDNSAVVLWLMPLQSTGPVAPGPMVQLVQKNKTFTPHMLVVTQGTEVEFPNRDPLFHDVFSIYQGKPFDLGLYESGATKKIRFTQPGISYIFCNIHPQMTAVIVVLKTPYYSITRKNGSFEIGQIPAGKYRLHVWYELASDSELASLTREIDLENSQTLQPITLHSSGAVKEHLNKYGEAYPAANQSQY